MKKRLKVVLLLILLLVIGVVAYLSFGGRRSDTVDENEPTESEVIADSGEVDEPISLEEEEGNFEEDVMKDLEGFFNNTNGYENIEGEYGFTNADLE